MPIIGFLVAPPIGALTWMLMAGGGRDVFSGISAYAAIVSIVLGSVLGLPTYCFLRAKQLINVISLSIGGAVIAMLPWVLLSDPSSTTKSAMGQTVIIENGAYTTEGMIFQIKFIAQFGLCGAVSGIVFWLIVRRLVTSAGKGRA